MQKGQHIRIDSGLSFSCNRLSLVFHRSLGTPSFWIIWSTTPMKITALLLPFALASTCALSGAAYAATPAEPAASPAKTAPAAPQVADQTPWIDGRALAIGLGAIGGVAILSLATGGAAMPMMAAGGASAAEGTVMVVGRGVGGRLYGITSAVIGGWVGDYLYRRNQDKAAAGAAPTP